LQTQPYKKIADKDKDTNKDDPMTYISEHWYEQQEIRDLVEEMKRQEIKQSLMAEMLDGLKAANHITDVEGEGAIAAALCQAGRLEQSAKGFNEILKNPDITFPPWVLAAQERLLEMFDASKQKLGVDETTNKVCIPILRQRRVGALNKLFVFRPRRRTSPLQAAKKFQKRYDTHLAKSGSVFRSICVDCRYHSSLDPQLGLFRKLYWRL
jgi:hypothetical protein